MASEAITYFTSTKVIRSQQSSRKMACSISYSTVARVSPPQQLFQQSSLGNLNRLFTEILTKAFEFLDFRSLGRLRQVSTGTKAVVEQVPAYQNLTKLVPTVLHSLSNAGCITNHSAAHILETMKSNRCMECNDGTYGWKIFLPTLERVCEKCSISNNKYRTVDIQIAIHRFALPEVLIRQWIQPILVHSKIRIVGEVFSVRLLLVLALHLHGSMEALQMASDEITASSMQKLRGMAREERLNLSFNPRKAATLDNLTSIEPTRHCEQNVATCSVPWLDHKGELAQGFYCQGCIAINKAAKFPSNRAPLPRGYTLELLEKMSEKTWLREDFLDHIKECYPSKVNYMKGLSAWCNGSSMETHGNPSLWQVSNQSWG